MEALRDYIGPYAPASNLQKAVKCDITGLIRLLIDRVTSSVQGVISPSALQTADVVLAIVLQLLGSPAGVSPLIRGGVIQSLLALLLLAESVRPLVSDLILLVCHLALHSKQTLEAFVEGDGVAAWLLHLDQVSCPLLSRLAHGCPLLPAYVFLPSSLFCLLCGECSFQLPLDSLL